MLESDGFLYRANAFDVLSSHLSMWRDLSPFLFSIDNELVVVMSSFPIGLIIIIQLSVLLIFFPR